MSEDLDWATTVARYSLQIAVGFRMLGIEKTPDEVRQLVEEELENAFRQTVREQLYNSIKGIDGR